MKIAIVGMMLVVMLAACSRKEVSFDTTETARAQAKDNARWNAQAALAEDPKLAGLEIYSRGDSTQTSDCPQGDGWASVDYLSAKTKQVVAKYKCSTVSKQLGCMSTEDFKGRPQYAQMEGHCQPVNRVPFPLPKITE